MGVLRISHLAYLAVPLALVGTTGCGGSSGRATTATAARTVTVFFLDDQGRRLVAERRSTTREGSLLEVALAELEVGPRRPGLVAALPPGTRVRHAGVDKGTARVDLSPQFVVGYPSGGASAEIAVLAPIVFTATELPGIERVLLTVDGHPPGVAGSQFDLASPLTRRDFPPELVP